MQEFLTFIDTWFRPVLLIFATLIGLYLTFKKFGYSISVTYAEVFNKLSHQRISDIVITNHKDRPIALFSIIAVFDKEISLTLQECNPPLILKPYETLAITTDAYSSLSINGHLYEPELFKAEIYLETSDKLVKCKARKKPNLDQSFRRVMKKIRTFNGIVHSDMYKYLLVYKINSELKTTFIHFSGYFENDWNFAFNMIKTNNGADIEASEIMATLKKYGLLQIFETYALYEIKSHSYELVERKEESVN